MTKRVLLIGHVFMDAGMGGTRVRRIARLLPSFGWQPVVLTHPRDHTSVSDLPEEVRVEEVKALDLVVLYDQLRGAHRKSSIVSASPAGSPSAKNIGLTSKINRWLMIPDKQVTWSRPAVHRGLELLRQEKFDAIFASLEPRTCLMVGAQLSRRTKIPFIAEYRDLWVGNPYYHLTQPTFLHRWIHSHLERKALRQAIRVSAVCRGIADLLAARHGSVLHAPISLNYNFFVPAEYPSDSVALDPCPFTVSYVGALYASRTPDQFFQGMQMFIQRSGLSAERFRFRWAGSISGIPNLSEILDRYQIRPYIDFLGQISHPAALRLLVGSHVSLVIQSPNDAVHIPGKLFEAMGGRVPVLALANPCEMAEIVSRCRAGIVCSHKAASVAQALEDFYRHVCSGNKWPFNEEEVIQFSAEPSVRRLAALLDAATTPN